MASIENISASTPARSTRPNWLVRDLVGLAVILVVAAIGYFLFPNNLALLTRILGVALLVLSIDLVTGFCGIATLGHAALFGAGAYASGIAAVHFGITDPLLMVVVGAVGGAVAGVVSGAVILRGHGLAQLVLSIAVVHLFHEAANKASAYTGGSDGLSGITPDPVFGIFAFDLWGRTAYGFAVALVVITFIVLRLITRSPFGMLCRGIKEDPIRIRAMGASVQGTLLKMYVISGAVAGTGGALNAISTQVVGLDSLSFTLSAEALVMLVLGGTGSLYGALIGTVSFMWFEDFVSAANPFHWLTIVGALLIAVVLFAPRGLYGTGLSFVERFRGNAK
ncbi:branched-chain amino acid ABC transporter permease [Aminobacter carboxidus]|uniref:Branched-chain amino acid ABC transporter permease n=1 Tax=Aminobacter carboxidus TaxID=376165 RepID=A0A8E1WFD8_9HYPH|nr:MULTISPECIES: branched-chain amino acid ABC transporter permease [Aminobacter carboxidus group]MBB6467776.1 branched-chain amino acid transport system permease protein [Aminobacter lissarensis]MBE1206619.1 branched-chain amino acid ABC transporter permease [Aminobacter carboxidus]